MKIATLGFMVKDNAVLLGQKKDTEIGAQTLNGAGGKQEGNETLEECLVREHQEEFGVTPTAFEKAAVIRFLAGEAPDFEVHTYLITAWEGEPSETDEMEMPQWYPFNAVPYDRMLESDCDWVHKVLAGERFRAEVHYRERAAGYMKCEFFPFET